MGDLAGNAEKMRGLCTAAKDAGVDLLIFPEMAICGYPPEDLLYKEHFIEDCRGQLENFAQSCPAMMVIAGYVERHICKIHNSAAVLREGQIREKYRKGRLINTGVFDEKRYFEPGTEPVVIDIDGVKVALTICFDLWDADWVENFYKNSGRIDLLVNLSASPYHIGKNQQRKEVIRQCAQRLGCAVAYCNMVGGQDELVFDGQSLLSDSTGRIVSKAKAFEQDLLIADVTVQNEQVQILPQRPLEEKFADELDEIFQALALGTRDYATKNGFEKVLIGLSGGIDSSLVAAIAVAALGKENVICITMPTKFNSSETISDAEKLAKNLGIEFLNIPIQKTLEEFDKTLDAVQGWDNKQIAFENLQARIRGCIMMSLSNQFRALVLTCGNKSETAVGYATLYGDTAGGFAVIKDVFKTKVYQLARHINKINDKDLIPEDVISRPPSAELRPGQRDSDSLPDYDILDEILKGYVEQDCSAMQLIAAGLDKNEVQRIIRLVDLNEYKRRQSPPGVKITPKAFGKDRRLPITNAYRHRQ